MFVNIYFNESLHFMTPKDPSMVNNFPSVMNNFMDENYLAVGHPTFRSFIPFVSFLHGLWSEAIF